MEEVNKKDMVTMKLLHYFITNNNYNPVILHGAKNEIWLENMDNEYRIIRIVSNYIHNNDQLNTDLLKTQKIVQGIKKKTLTLKIKVLSIFIDLGDNVNLEEFESKNIKCIDYTNKKNFKETKFIYEDFPDIDKKLKFTEEGLDLFIKITDEINMKNQEVSEKINKTFKPQNKNLTYILMGINIAIFLFGFLLNQGEYLFQYFSVYGPLIREGQYYRLITGTFVHLDIFHILFNMYALYIIGQETEQFYGKAKYLIIYLASSLAGSLLSIIVNGNTASIGASGAVFGLFGALIYFGYNYRVYFGNKVLRQIVPIVFLNLLLGFSIPSIDVAAHIGGLIGGFLVSASLGLKIGKENENNSKTNYIIMTILLFLFLIGFNFIYIPSL